MPEANVTVNTRVDVSQFQAALWCCAYEAALLTDQFYPSTTESENDGTL